MEKAVCPLLLLLLLLLLGLSSSEWISSRRDAAHSSGNGMVSSSAPSSPSCGSFHVFLSFRGPDVRNTFLGHLHYSLDREGIRTYIDREDLQSGDEISLSLKKAIHDSRIAVVIFSENYASSRWCLNELAEIMDRRKQGQLVVKPVFYRVEPREVRTPTYSFAEALATHEFKLGKDSDMVMRWREALFEAGNLSGWHLDANGSNGNEAELVMKIVKDVNVVLDRTHLDVARYPVGIESRVAQIKIMLNMKSDEVLLIGLWGMAGVGKTTLAKAVVNAVAHQFDGYAFLPNVREGSANPGVGLAQLQEKLLSEVLGRKDANIQSIASGISRIKDRLCQKKVLLLLDDISSTEQLDTLAGGPDWFGNGSRILITTRDKFVLAARKEHVVHKVEGLPYTQALQLFSKHAFPENDRPDIAKDLVDRCLAYCDALPLALVVLGSLLRNREERHWKSMLNMLEQQGPCKEIDKVLGVGFDELDHNAREIFLHIACFFKGKCRRDIEKAMDARGFETSLGIDVLIERSLITIVEDTTCDFSVERVEMHHLLQLMGHNIVRRESLEEPSKRSRQWVYEDACGVLSNGMGTNTVKGLASRSPRPKEVCFSADALTNLKKSTLLNMGNDHYDGDPMCFPHELRWIERSGYSAPDTLFSRPRKFKVHDSICRVGIFRHSSRVDPDGESWRNSTVARSVGECRLQPSPEARRQISCSKVPSPAPFHSVSL